MALPMIQAAAAGAAGAVEDLYDEVVMPLSLALAERCDAILRAAGASASADREIARMRARGCSVYDSIDDVPDGRAAAASAPRDFGT